MKEIKIGLSKKHWGRQKLKQSIKSSWNVYITWNNILLSAIDWIPLNKIANNESGVINKSHNKNNLFQNLGCTQISILYLLCHFNLQRLNSYSLIKGMFNKDGMKPPAPLLQRVPNLAGRVKAEDIKETACWLQTGRFPFRGGEVEGKGLEIQPQGTARGINSLAEKTK